MAHVFHARPRFLRHGLLRIPFVFPLAHSLGAARCGTLVVVPMQRCIRGHSRLRRNSPTSFWAVWASLFRVGWVGRMLRIRRLRGRHSVVVHRGPAIVPRTAGTVRHQGVRSPSTWAGTRARLEHGGGGVTAKVRVPDTRRGLGYLGRLLSLLRRRRRRRCVVRRRRRGRAPSLLLRHPVALRVRSQLLFLLRAGLSLTGWGLATKGLTLASVRVSRLRRRVDLRNPAVPGIRAGALCGAVEHRLRLLRWLRRWCRPRSRPLGPRRASSLVRLGVDVSRHRRLRWRGAVRLSAPEQLQPRLDVGVSRIKLSSTLVRIKGIRDLVIARLVLQGGTRVSNDPSRVQIKHLIHLPECPGHTTLPRCWG